MDINLIPVKAVVYADRLRQLDVAKVSQVASSVTELGRLLNPITVRRIGGGCYALIAGLHRLEAFKQLGRTEIPATVIEVDNLTAKLAEIDENLFRNELTVLERGEHLMARKGVYEELHPETKAGGDRKSKEAESKRNNSVLKFSEDTATKLGVSESTIQQEVKIAADLAPDVKRRILGTELEDSKKELIELSRADHNTQRRVLDRIEAGEVDSVTEALRPSARVSLIVSDHQIINSSESNEYYTPVQFIDAARRVMGGIDLDPASSPRANETVKAKKFYTIHDDGFTKEWYGCVWMNPPYGKDFITSESNQARWTEKIINEYRSGRVRHACVLINAVPGNQWFLPLWEFPICFVYGRIKFVNSGSPTHSSAIVYLGDNIAGFVKEFSPLGAVARRLDADAF